MSANNSTGIHDDLPLTIEFELPDLDDNTTHPIDENYLFYGYPVVVPLAILIIIIIVLAVGGNVMVIMTIVRHRGMRTRTNMFIVNLAVADILVAVLDMPVSLTTIIEGRWVFGDTLCKLNGFTMALFLICSIHTLMYISVHKYISITRPFSRAMTPRRIRLMIFASWLWAALCATGPLIGWNRNVYKKGASQCGPSIPKGLLALSHSLLITTSNYIVPLVVMSFCYSKIFREIHIHMQRIRKTSNIDLENSVAQQKKVATTLFLVLACFLLCWTPFVLYSNAAALIKDKSKIPPILNPLAYWCGYLNSACNPIIYAFRSPSFRKGYKEIMCGVESPGLTGAVDFTFGDLSRDKQEAILFLQEKRILRKEKLLSNNHLTNIKMRLEAETDMFKKNISEHKLNSLSFRSRSARGSLKSASNVCITKQEETKSSNAAVRRQRTMLSQTSWRSLPLMPTLFRTFSSKHQESTEDSIDSPQVHSDCGFCGLFKPRPVSSGIAKSEGTVTRLPNPSSFDDIKEESQEDNANADTKLMDRSSFGDIEEETPEETENFVSRPQSPCFISTQEESQEDAV